MIKYSIRLCVWRAFHPPTGTWLVHEDVHQPQMVERKGIHATAENRPLPARQQETGPRRWDP